MTRTTATSRRAGLLVWAQPSLAVVAAEPGGLGCLDLGRPLALEAALRVAVVAELGRAEDVHTDVAQAPHEAVAEA